MGAPLKSKELEREQKRFVPLPNPPPLSGRKGTPLISSPERRGEEVLGLCGRDNR